MRLFGTLFLLLVVELCSTTANEKYTKTKRRLYGLCPPGFTQINVECYYISDAKANWLDAHFECKDKNSRLAEPTKFADKHLRKYLVTKDKDRTQLWIGGTYDWKSNKWQWGHSGKEVKYHAFSAAEQRSSKELEYHCAVMDPDKKYRWSAKSCADRYRFICQHRMPKVSRKNREKIYNRWNTTYPNQMANEFILEITDFRVNGTRTHRKIRPVPTNELVAPAKETQKAKVKKVDPPVILNDMQISFTNLVPEDPNEFTNGAPPEQRRLPRTHIDDVSKAKAHDNTVQTEFDRRVEIQRRQEFERKQRRRLQRRKKLQREREERERAEVERQRQIQAQKMREEQLNQQETEFENQRNRIAEEEKVLETQKPLQIPVTTSQPIQDNRSTNEALPSPDESTFAERLGKDEPEPRNEEVLYDRGSPLQHKEEKETPEIPPYREESPPRTEFGSDFRQNNAYDDDRARREHKLQMQEEAQRAEEERRYLEEIGGYTTDAYEAERARLERDRLRLAEIERKHEEERRLREEILRKENEEREQLEREMREKELAYQKALEEEEQRRKEEEDRRQREEMQKVQARAEKRRKAEQRRRQLLREREEAATQKAKEMQKEAERLRQQRIRDRIQNLSPEKRELFFKEREKQRQKRRLERQNRNEISASEQE